ncbi:MAG: hypothetical protein ACREUG_11645 [Steroidobacteraceae bacterium]
MMAAIPECVAHNRAWTCQCLEREIAYCAREAEVLRLHAARLCEKAYILEREAQVLEHELAAVYGGGTLPMLLLKQAG